MNILEKITTEQLNSNITDFRVGNTVKVGYKVPDEKNKGKYRIQYFEGIVISRKGRGISETFTVRRVTSGVGVEKTYPIHSPKIDSLTVTKKGKARRAKMYFLRERKKQYKMKERN
ncbi:MAG: 50S ribosomal protein L19 [bacterium]|nr:50S ribosomal protein L19 [bacterium]